MDAGERRTRASEEAAGWWVILHADDVPRTAREEFVDWLRESPVHVAEMLHIGHLHGALEQFQMWADVQTEGSSEKQPDVIAFPRARPDSRCADLVASGDARTRRWIGAIVVAVGLAVSGLAWLVRTQGAEVIRTTLGERREVQLTDGSVIDLDPQTRLRVRLEASARRVSLEEGRALFHAAKDPNRPFMVQVDGTLVRAIGTAFGVERQKEGIVVTVAEGRVAVMQSLGADRVTARFLDPGPDTAKSGNATLQEATQESADIQLPALKDHAGSRAVFLNAGQQVTVTPSGSADPVRRVNSGRELAWAQGHLVFDSNTVADVVKQFNRYNRVQLHVSDPMLASRPISGVFDASDPESFIAFIRRVMSAVRVVRSGQDITLVRQPKKPVLGTASSGQAQHDPD